MLHSAFGPRVITEAASHPPLRPVPRAGDPAWSSIDPSSAADIRDQAHDVLAEPWPELTPEAWRDFFETGRRTTYEAPYFERRRRLATLALAAAIESGGDDGVAYDAMVDGIRLILAEPTWCVPAHNTPPGGALLALPDPDRPVLDLFAAETAALLSWTLALHGQTLPREVAALVQGEIDTRVLQPFERDARSYHWFGLPSNWNPWVVSNTLTCALLTDVSPACREIILTTAIESLDAYLDQIPGDGGCPEGVMYWWQSAARLFEAIELLGFVVKDASDEVFRQPLLRALARYPMIVSLGEGDWNAIFGDGAARRPKAGGGSMKDRHPPALLWRFGRRADDADVAHFARVLRGKAPAVELPLPLGRAALALFDDSWRDADVNFTPEFASHPQFLPETQVFSATSIVRMPGSDSGRAATRGLRLVAKGGHNGEPHNHNDVGSFVIAAGGEPLLIDVGSGRYTAASFTAARYEQWFTTSNFHNVPVINGRAQPPGREFGARSLQAELEDESWSFALDLATAYTAETEVGEWTRRFGPDGNGGICVTDAWRSHSGLDVGLTIMLARMPRQEAPGAFGLVGPDTGDVLARLSVDPKAATVSAHAVPLDDPTLSAVWGPEICRLIVRPQTDAVSLDLVLVPIIR